MTNSHPAKYLLKTNEYQNEYTIYPKEKITLQDCDFTTQHDIYRFNLICLLNVIEECFFEDHTNKN